MEWYYAQDRQQKGPVSHEQFVELVGNGIVGADTLVWRQGMAAWQPYGQVLAASKLPSDAAAAAPSAQPAGPAVLSSMPTGSEEKQRDRALGMVKGPAICLMILGVLSAYAAVETFQGASQTDIYDQIKGVDAQMIETMKRMHPVSSMVSAVITLVCGIVMFIGGYRMMNLKSYGLAMAAAICTFQPCVCPWCCVGLLFGIWALVVLNNSEVKEQFR